MPENARSKIIRTISRFYETMGTGQSFKHGIFHEECGEACLFQRLQRALTDDAEGADADRLRYAIWADNIQDILLAAGDDWREGRIDEASRKLILAVNALGAYKDAQVFLDPSGKSEARYGRDVYAAYVRHLLDDPSGRGQKCDKSGIVDLLSRQFRQSGEGRRGWLRLPANIDFTLVNHVLQVHIHNPVANMQTNEAAFEAWILILKAWIPEIEWAVLDYDVPADLAGRYLAGSRRGHYNRFLFRLAGFAELYGDWFVLTSGKQAEIASFMAWLKKGPSLLNRPLAEAKSVITTDKMERQIESWLTFETGKPLLCRRLGLDQDRVFNQLPVGVFHGEIAAGNAIFSRGASAVDLWGISPDRETLHLIELKCGGNKGVGIISETLFYTHILHQACLDRQGCIAFGTWGNGGDQRGIEHLRSKKYAKIALHYMAEQFHPLFDDRVLALINDGLARWDAAADQVLYDYQAQRIEPV